MPKKKDRLKNYLARKRTLLANERTLLAYWRTALAFVGLGVLILKFFDPSIWLTILTTFCIIFGVVLFVYSSVKYLRFHRRVSKSYLETKKKGISSNIKIGRHRSNHRVSKKRRAQETTS